MPIYDYEKERALAEIFTYILIKYDEYINNEISKIEFEKSKDGYLYNKSVYREFLSHVSFSPRCLLFADPNKTALDVLNDLISRGAINEYEYYTLKERHKLR